MVQITVSEKDYKESNLLYAQSLLASLSAQIGFTLKCDTSGSRSILTLNCPEYYADAVSIELADILAEIVAINYKYDFFKKRVRVSGLSKLEYEILMASLISADLEEDKRYTLDKLRGIKELAVDGIYNFRLQPLKRKWEEIVSYMPTCFVNSQLKDFVSFLIENKHKTVFVEEQRVYDFNYRRLNRAKLLGGDELLLLREVLLSGASQVEIKGNIPSLDEKYLKEYYGDRVYFVSSFTS